MSGVSASRLAAKDAEIRALRARVAKLEAALKEARIEFEMWHEAKNILAKIDAALKDAPQDEPFMPRIEWPPR